MNEVDNIANILERMSAAAKKAEESGEAILRILDTMISIEELIEENKNG